MEALRSQLYSAWEVCLAEEELSPASRDFVGTFAGDGRVRMFRGGSALAKARGDLVLRLQPGDSLAEHALFAVAEVLEARPELSLVYADDDGQDEGGQRVAPAFKPDWSPELLRSRDYIGRAAFFRTERVRALGGWPPGVEDLSSHLLLLRYTAGLARKQVEHLPLVLLHRGPGPRGLPDVDGGGPRAIQGVLSADGTRARVESGRRAATYRIRYALPEPAPLVSIIIPTRDQPSLLQRCIRSLSTLTAYQPVELVVVDNDSRDRRAVALLEELARTGVARVLRYRCHSTTRR